MSGPRAPGRITRRPLAPQRQPSSLYPNPDCHKLPPPWACASTRTKGSSSSPLLRGWLFPHKPPSRLPRWPPSSSHTHLPFSEETGTTIRYGSLNFPPPPYLIRGQVPCRQPLPLRKPLFSSDIHPRNQCASGLSSAAKLLNRRAAQSGLRPLAPTDPLPGSQASIRPTLARGQVSPCCRTSDTEGHCLCGTWPGRGPLSPTCGPHWPPGSLPFSLPLLLGLHPSKS